MELTNRENQNYNVNKTFDDAHCEPEWKVNDIPVDRRTAREKVIDRVTRITDFDNGSCEAHCTTYRSNDNGRVAQVRWKEDPAVEEKNGHLSQGDHDEIEDAVNVDILQSWLAHVPTKILGNISSNLLVSYVFNSIW